MLTLIRSCLGSLRSRDSNHQRRHYVPTFEQLEERQTPAAIFVTNSLDDGIGSLRWAIQLANQDAQEDTIVFTIGDFVQTIHVGNLTTGQALPDITNPLIIDARPGPLFPTQIIELNGEFGNMDANGLTIRANSTIRGLVINKFKKDGILVLDGNAIIEDNLIGTDVTGTLPRGNLGNGVRVATSGGAVIGGTIPSARNVISANGMAGIFLDTESNGVRGNYIGTDITGLNQLGNLGPGIRIESSFNRIGAQDGGASRNTIADNGTGILIRRPEGALFEVRENQIIENNIGMAAGGLQVMANVRGIHILGHVHATVIDNNIVSGNLEDGILIENTRTGVAADATRISNNYIGLNRNGEASGNLGHGIQVNNSSQITVGPLNTIASNRGNGIWIHGVNTIDVSIEGKDSAWPCAN